MKLFEISLSYPPSVNKMYTIYNGRFCLTSAARAWILEAQLMINMGTRHVKKPFDMSKFKASYELIIKNNRKQDADNRIKIAQDMLVKCGLIKDDSLIDKVLITKRLDTTIKNEQIVIKLYSYGEQR